MTTPSKPVHITSKAVLTTILIQQHGMVLLVVPDRSLPASYELALSQLTRKKKSNHFGKLRPAVTAYHGDMTVTFPDLFCPFLVQGNKRPQAGC